jgi:hypothetical protein
MISTNGERIMCDMRGSKGRRKGAGGAAEEGRGSGRGRRESDPSSEFDVLSAAQRIVFAPSPALKGRGVNRKK